MVKNDYAHSDALLPTGVASYYYHTDCHRYINLNHYFGYGVSRFRSESGESGGGIGCGSYSDQGVGSLVYQYLNVVAV